MMISPMPMPQRPSSPFLKKSAIPARFFFDWNDNKIVTLFLWKTFFFEWNDNKIITLFCDEKHSSLTEMITKSLHFFEMKNFPHSGKMIFRLFAHLRWELPVPGLDSVLLHCQWAFNLRWILWWWQWRRWWWWWQWWGGDSDYVIGQKWRVKGLVNDDDDDGDDDDVELVIEKNMMDGGTGWREEESTGIRVNSSKW